MPKKPRRRLLVDARLQGVLICRVMMYWLLSLGVLLILVTLQALLTSREVDWPLMIGRTLTGFGPALIASMVLLPIVVYDALRFSHRFAGPVHRLKGEMRRLSDGEELQPVAFREGDYWGDLATEFNRLSDEVHRLRRDAAAPRETPTDQPDATPVS